MTKHLIKLLVVINSLFLSNLLFAAEAHPKIYVWNRTDLLCEKPVKSDFSTCKKQITIKKSEQQEGYTTNFYAVGSAPSIGIKLGEKQLVSFYEAFSVNDDEAKAVLKGIYYLTATPSAISKIKKILTIISANQNGFTDVDDLKENHPLYLLGGDPKPLPPSHTNPDGSFSFTVGDAFVPRPLYYTDDPKKPTEYTFVIVNTNESKGSLKGPLFYLMAGSPPETLPFSPVNQ